VFVNLDMEEYRDLELTIAAFTRVLGEPEFAGTDAGIVLQAYLPDSHAAAERLGAWSVERRRRGGGRLKIRLVKGANLAMESVEAELHGWVAAPYGSKADVDASYKRCSTRCCDPSGPMR
jgi:RHH-type transcriptional regulator, proline utilization regulon repressor / proline dehydrogenase / delta 1-pyrroline-5-carboxylate dehydrogenase